MPETTEKSLDVEVILFKHVPASQRYPFPLRRLLNWGLKIATLVTQYADVCAAGGVRFCCFNIDPTFNHCVDGLVMIDLRYFRPKKRIRYIGKTHY